ncbi:MAG: alpha/beta hydrolase [Spirochaetaceae bacterium]|jgi:pimeloyl-ACP methyl ester carboxylesterase|nr:alpha/beta hydrolase [Spirochaetaceae bacterium]
MKIDTLTEVSLNGLPQWVYIRSQNRENPILLFLHGGPGFPGIGIAQSYQSELEQKFTVVQWDQRGAGKSYSLDIPPETMNINQFISDLHELVLYLNNTINKQKIYLAGHSWGAMLGILAVKQYPELFEYFIGIGQTVSVGLTSEARLLFLIQEAQKRNDAEGLQILENARGNGFGALFQAEYDYAVKYGGAFYGSSDTNRLGEIFFIQNTLYTDSEKQSVPQGMQFSGILWNDIFTVNLMEAVTHVAIPVLFISGKHDMLSPVSVVTKYYETLKAPSKTILYFDQSAHFPFLEETEHFCDVINGL